MSASALLWRDAGCPDPWRPVDKIAAPCCLCGTHAVETVRAKDRFGAGFSDVHELARKDSSRVCAPCSWLLGSKPPQTHRMWSLVYREDWTAPPSHEKAAPARGPLTWLGNKADLSPVWHTLLDPPEDRWMVSVADSGQIHTAPYAHVNAGAYGVVRYERTNVTYSRDVWRHMIAHAACLYAAGFSRDEVLTGEPGTGRLVEIGIGVWRAHARHLTRWHNSPALELGLGLIRRDDAEQRRDEALAALGAGGVRPGGPAPARGAEEHVDRRHPGAGLVGAPDDRPADGGGAVGEPARHGVGDGAQAPDPHPPTGQLLLGL